MSSVKGTTRIVCQQKAPCAYACNPKDSKSSLFIKDGDKGVKEYPLPLIRRRRRNWPPTAKSLISRTNGPLQRLRQQGSRNRLVSTQTTRHPRLQVLQPAEKNQQANSRANRFNRPTRKVGLEKPSIFSPVAEPP